ncbi:hypothetical protein SETIT_3G041400v2 [Setaria italica]|uniref:Uncharacterized protein n=1 Tax=Setaria italica TaxID=4555 RepID=A0A368QB58_SETIT|nr:hypothetical protein SETIT_3G041400v2 [Setaria italica]
MWIEPERYTKKSLEPLSPVPYCCCCDPDRTWTDDRRDGGSRRRWHQGERQHVGSPHQDKQQPVPSGGEPESSGVGGAANHGRKDKARKESNRKQKKKQLAMDNSETSTEGPLAHHQRRPSAGGGRRGVGAVLQNSPHLDRNYSPRSKYLHKAP